MPSTFVGLIILLAALGPGYIFAATRAKRVPEVKRSDLRELVELALVGSLCTVLALLVVAEIGSLLAEEFDAWPTPTELTRILKDPLAYVLVSPWRVTTALVGLAVVLLLACGAAFALATTIYSGHQPSINPRGSAWQAVFMPEDQDKVVTLLMDDGSQIVGYARGFTVGTDDEHPRELLLGPPILAKRDRSSSPGKLPVDWLVVRSDQIRVLTVEYRPRERTEGDGQPDQRVTVNEPAAR